ncbi:hypothetical protein SMACR_03823 [Sordaria macrospora]|uniref:WGS project CABT00000000 data, contig 2.16 n=2 Tax=Sordaria macrospora TaxID=5147 RepID=F7W017_SORMK|nr:uncharacterized protein SMAC_03823 [Sordaria macrospora k-hell]KAA8630165.1 hypothetical protein SMACR_03823 [Sordaria macrospora]KAH7629830.1 hypothetical protein B0T09DRAFT_340330 [Sordaria sp. MPI-SDFR-AT-0083]WPJ66527.1 hypothetical protein SMAC4_03823 [Sordaria macrospora]CCC11116.1 unnamed protein product [Sordaria macrospora k-hell]
MVPTVPAAGIWVPAITLFNPQHDTLDLESQAKYFRYLSSPEVGLAGLLILGTNAETFLLTREERYELLRCACRTVPKGFPIMAGVSGHSNAQVKEYIDDAVKAGADYVLVLPPGYFGPKGLRGGEQMVEDFFDEVATYSRLPVLIYNFPAVCGGIDLSSTLITRLAKRHKGKIVGCKLTCGSVAKITRLASDFEPEKKEFAIFGGQSDFLIGGLAVGSSGCIAAFGNVFPRALVGVYNKWVQWDEENDKVKRGQAIFRSGLLALAEEHLKADGIAAVKYAASLYTGWRAGILNGDGRDGPSFSVKDGTKGMELFRPRKPYPETNQETKQKIRKAVDGVLYLGWENLGLYDEA